MRIRVSLLRELKYRLRAALGRSKRSKHRFPIEPALAVKLESDIDPASLKFRPSDAPKVSILIPCYGQVRHTLNCLKSLAARPPRVPFEILVVEDASKDPEIPRLREVQGIRLIENAKNLGFLLSCNAAAEQAQGEYLFFLNNDTIVHAGAVDELVAFAESHPEAGLVGSRLLFEDGYLQEAGGILWSDGSAWNYGRSQNPARPEFSYTRETDYISGAAILTPRRVWNELAGFDPHFAPAYCEDSDYAMRVRAAGLKVYYLPTSTVSHFEGVSHGVNTNAGVKAYQVVNQRKLVERHAAVLAREHYPNAQHVMRARDHAHDKRILLIVDHYAPEPDRDAGSRTMIEMIRTFQSMNYVVKFWPDNKAYNPKYTPPLQRMGVEVLYKPYVESLEDWLEQNGGDIDLVLLSRPRELTRALPAVRRFTEAPVLYYGHDLHFQRQQRESEVMNKPEKAKGARKLFELERNLWRDTDATIYPSQDEINEVRRIEPATAAFAMSAYVFDRFSDRPVAAPGARIIFVAGFAHPPNVDAAVWLVDQVFPLILKARPDASLTLIGSNPSEEVVALSSDRVDATGWVSDEELRERYLSARVAVVPLRFGAGVKLKVVEAMAEGAPLVTTPVGAQGLPGLEEAVSVRESAEDFAEEVLRYLNASDYAWLEASRRGVAYAKARFGRAAMRKPLEKAIEAAKSSAAKQRRPSCAAE